MFLKSNLMCGQHLRASVFIVLSGVSFLHIWRCYRITDNTYLRSLDILPQCLCVDNHLIATTEAATSLCGVTWPWQSLNASNITQCICILEKEMQPGPISNEHSELRLKGSLHKEHN